MSKKTKPRKNVIGQAADREGLARFAGMARPLRYGHRDVEELDTTPIEVPLGACRPTPLQDLIAQMVRQQIESETDQEYGSMEDEDDFEEEDPDTLDFSAYDLTNIDEELPWEAATLEESPPQDPDPGQVGDQTGDQPDPDVAEPDQQ